MESVGDCSTQDDGIGVSDAGSQADGKDSTGESGHEFMVLSGGEYQPGCGR
jgi:hypothetical protein